MIKVLEKLGCGVNYNPDQTCCGRPAYEDGYQDHCKETGEKLIREFQDDRNIVCAGPACVATVKNYYLKLFHNTSLHNEYRQVGKHFHEFSDFLSNVLKVTDAGSRYNARAFFLHSCYSDSGSSANALSLMEKVRGLEITGTSNQGECCGAGGGLDRKNEEITFSIGSALLEKAKASGAEVIISNEYSCLMNLEGIIRKQNIPLKTVHIADVLASGWE